MSKATIKMIGLALMAVSIFAILFGIHVPALVGAPEALSSALVAGGVLALLVGFILYALQKS